ncbi:response regulator [Desulfothermobacter acidiphilus]|uniref:response regulator n=1 Tax=Desulfothermobacter acidiphilus TaxID=1938353 RepID=UPI003F89328B
MSYLLVVDDEPLVRLVMREALAAAGWRVAEASGGDEARELIAQERPELVVLDLNCPGGEALRHELQGQVPLVLVTGDEGVGEELGVPVLHKPFDLNQLRQLIRSELSGL